MPIPLGVLAVAGAGAGGGGAAGSYDLLATTLITSDVNGVDFNNLSNYNTYQHLQLRISHRYSNQIGVDGATFQIFFNGDYGSNTYNGRNVQYNISDGSITASSYTSFGYAFGGFSLGNSLGQFSTAVIDILDPYETSKFTTFKSLNGGITYNLSNNLRVSNIGLWSGAWRNTAALTSLGFRFDGGQRWMDGTRISIYGLKAV